MTARAVHAFGRKWSHQQFHRLVNRLVEGAGISVNFYKTHNNSILCRLSDIGDESGVCRGYGITTWTALCAAVERMGGE